MQRDRLSIRTNLSKSALTRSPSPQRWNGLAASAVAMTAVLAGSARADNRSFTFVHEATTMPAGGLEYEQSLTWETAKESDSDFDRLRFRHELEYGLTNDWQLSFYFSDWEYEDGRSVEDDGAEWRDVALESILNLSDPVDDVIGSALYGEAKVGDEFVELEGKLILQKNFGKFVTAYNATVEAEWEGPDLGDLHEKKGEIEQSLGLSYQFSPALRGGVELVHAFEIDDWSEKEDDAVYLGPNVSLAQGGWWMTLTPLAQLTDNDDEPDLKMRLIFGISF